MTELNVSSEVNEFVSSLLDAIKTIVGENLVGFYIHGSLAMGGFNPKNSDIDGLVVTHCPLNAETKRQLAEFFLKQSNNPFPVEVSFLNEEQLKRWKHPSPFDFHFSEFWRERNERDLTNGTSLFLNEEVKTDADLAAHLTITKNRGICIEGPSIEESIPPIPSLHYLSSILGDYQDCLANLLIDPIYCIFNMLRVYWYLKEGRISSKLEAGRWGLTSFSEEFVQTIEKVVESFAAPSVPSKIDLFNTEELIKF